MKNTKFSRSKDSIINFFDKIYKKIFKKNKIIKQIILWYLLIAFLGSILLMLPFFHASGTGNFNFLDSIFISSSAFSDTGLSVFSISENYNFFGELIIILLVIFGGFGFFTMKLFFINYIFRKKTSIEESDKAIEELSSRNKNESLKIIKVSIWSFLIFTFIFSFIFAFYFCFSKQLDESLELKGNFLKSLWTGFFHSASSINNAGFDIFEGDSSMSLLYDAKIFQALTLFLFIFGGIGFAVIYDFITYIKQKSKGKNFEFSLFTKVAFFTYFLIFFSGIFLSIGSELVSFGINKENSFYGASSSIYGNWWDKTWALIFNSSSTRNAGFSTIDFSLLNDFTKIVYVFMMFIGSGPGSTAGGIRTITFMILILFVISKIRRKQNIYVFKRTISEKTIKNSLRVFILSFFIILIAFISTSINELFIFKNQKEGLVDYLFLVVSAFGTTGLSSFSLNEGAISFVTKIIIIILMFVGQIGITNILTLSSIHNEKDKSAFKKQKIKNYKYLKEELPLN